MLVRRCLAFGGPGSVEERREDAAEAARLARAGGDQAVERAARRLAMVAAMEGGDLASADAQIEAVAVAAPGWWPVPLWRAMRALLQGRFDECQARHADVAAAAGAGWAPEAVAADGATADQAAADLAAGLQFAALRTAQDRLLELEAPVRALVERHPSDPAARTALAALLGRLGRDGESAAELARLAPDRFAAVGDGHQAGWLATLCHLGELAALLGRQAEAVVLYDLLLPHAGRLAVDPEAAACHGSVARPLALLAAALGRQDVADAHFAAALDANRRAGAPLLVAHTARQWSALLRVRDRGTDWDRALDVLAEAEAIYRRLGVDRLADDARGVLARSFEPPAVERDARANAFRQEGHEWVVSYGGRNARLPDSTGMHDLALLVANPSRSFHVLELLAGPGATGVGTAHRSQRPTRILPPDGPPTTGRLLGTGERAEYAARLDELDRELAEAEVSDDPVRSSLARAERDLLAAELRAPGPAAAGGSGDSPGGDPAGSRLPDAPGGDRRTGTAGGGTRTEGGDGGDGGGSRTEGGGGEAGGGNHGGDEGADERPDGGANGPRHSQPEDDPVERARRIVATRIRLSLDAVEAASPALGRHLRHTVHTGTFCSYEPEGPAAWATRPGR
ncbi:MAG: hypothetical protein ABR511_00230 [Acidimicrobiales bacterium]